jgi:parallel beta-helix repeat protein
MKAFRRASQRCLLLLAAATMMALVGGTSEAAASPTMIITSDTTLGADYNGQIIVVGTGVTLNCDGHHVIGAGVGVGINAVANAVTVTRCQVHGFDVGILTSADATKILLNAVTSNDQGIRLAGATNGIVGSNRANSNRSFGIIAAQSGTGNTIRGNEVDRNGLIGIALNTVAGNAVTGNFANQNGGTGIDSLLASRNEIAKNVASNNGNIGFGFQSSSDNRVLGNTANNNGIPGNGFGFNFNNSSGNIVTKNAAFHNGGVGFFVFFASQANQFRLNTGCENFFQDAADISTGSGNTWKDNTFCVTLGI